MPRIAGVTTATPPHVFKQEEAKALAQSIFGGRADRLLPVFDNANIDQRYFAADPQWISAGHTFTELNDCYIETALELTERVVCRLAEQCGIATTDFDAIFFVSTTGVSTPSIDARLFNRIPLSRHIKRIPIWGLGCAGGASALARACDYTKAYPTHRALVVTVELCSLTFQTSEQTKSNIIATALFGDGAAACLVVGDEAELHDNGMAHPSFHGSLSTIYEDSLDVMGWRITTEGFKVVLSKDIPSIVTSLVHENIMELVRANGISAGELKHFIMHPGGTKVLEAFCNGLQITMHELRHSVEVLKKFGNMSSTTVYFILDRFLRETQNGTGEYGLLSALGPGFSSELVLLRWD